LKKQQQKKAIFSILSPNSNIHENHERLQFFFSSCKAISNVLPWQYQGYVHRNVKASLAISRLLPMAISRLRPSQYQGYSHGTIKLPWQCQGYFHSMAISWLLPSTSFSPTNSSCRSSSNNNHIPAFSTIFVSLKKTKHLKRQI
jgi:hypothetical protein